jgi:hypothetical protein
MKLQEKSVFFILILALFITPSCTELQGIVNEANSKIPNQQGNSLTETEVISGLKEALTTGTRNTVAKLSAVNGFYQDATIKIPFPEEAIKVKETALKFGLDQQVNKFEETLNRAAETASKEAADVFVNAITAMTIQDAWGILKGSNDAATSYLIKTTSSDLHDKFYPIVSNATQEVMLTKYWTPLIEKYNTATLLTGGEPIETDLNEYVTQKALDGLYKKIAIEEGKIRKDPVARVSDLLKKVFSYLD